MNPFRLPAKPNTDADEPSLANELGHSLANGAAYTLGGILLTAGVKYLANKLNANVEELDENEGTLFPQDN